MGAVVVVDLVLKYFLEHKNMTVMLADIEHETGLSTNQVQNAISNLRSRGKQDIQTVIAGRSWVYKGQSEKTISRNGGPLLFELLATAKNGDLIIQDDSGNLYRATAL